MKFNCLQVYTVFSVTEATRAAYHCSGCFIIILLFQRLTDLYKQNNPKPPLVVVNKMCYYENCTKKHFVLYDIDHGFCC